MRAAEDGMRVLYEPDDMVAMNRLAARKGLKRPGFRAVILLGILGPQLFALWAYDGRALLFVMLGNLLVIGLILLLFFVVWGMWIYPRYVGRRTLMAQPSLRGEHGYCVTPDAVHVTSQQGRWTYPWSDICGWCENDQVVLLVIERNLRLNLVLPKRAMPPGFAQNLQETLRAAGVARI